MSTLNILIIPEEDMHRFAETDFTVKVAGWSKPRPVYRRGPHLVMDIAVSDCMCNTCVRRFATVLFSMRDRKVEYEVGSWNKSCAVRFTNPGGISDDEICGFLTDRLGIEVSNLEKVAPS